MKFLQRGGLRGCRPGEPAEHHHGRQRISRCSSTEAEPAPECNRKSGMELAHLETRSPFLQILVVKSFFILFIFFFWCVGCDITEPSEFMILSSQVDEIASQLYSLTLFRIPQADINLGTSSPS